MSVKIICNDLSINVENFEELICVEQKGRKWVLINCEGSELNFKMQVKNACVKYTPEKYDKITLDLDSSSKEFFEKLQEHLKLDVDIENFVKGNSIGLKMSRDQKLLCTKQLQKGDYVDIVVKFNDIWKVNGKIYASLELLQFRKLDKAPKIEVINYFVDE